MKNFILHYARYAKNVREKNCSFQKDLQILCGLYFYVSYIFSFINKKYFFFKNSFSEQNYTANKKKILVLKLSISRRYRNLLETIF